MTEPGAGTVGIAPWLSVRDGAAAVAFYREAFGAEERYRLDGDGEVIVAQLSVDGADFWIQHDPEGSPVPGQAGPIRMIVSVADPDTAYARAVAAGATEVAPVSEGHGWRIGRVVDPFGHHWEFGRRLDS